MRGPRPSAGPAASAPRPGSRFRAVLIAAVCLSFLGILGCTPGAPDPSGPRPLTEEESYRLSAFRFKNFDKGVRQVKGTLKEAQEDFTVAGWVDFPSETGLAKIIPTNTTSGTPPFLVNWSTANINFLTLQPTDTGSDIAPTRPEGDWQATPFNPNTSVLAAGLAALNMLSSDRPENALLVRQGGARWLGSERIDAEQTDIFSGPTPSNQSAPPTNTKEADDRTQYWIAKNTGLLLRFDIRLLAGKDLSSFTFADPVPAPETLPSPSPPPTTPPRTP